MSSPGTVAGVDDQDLDRDRDRDLDDAIEGCAAAHQRLLADLDSLPDDEAPRPSLLPGGTVGPVPVS